MLRCWRWGIHAYRACKKLSTMASVDCMGIVKTVRRVYDGLFVYQDGRIIPPDILDTNASLLELVYHTLLITIK